MVRAANVLRERWTPVIYGTVRLIERDRDTFLAWGREPWACVVVNLHVSHAPAGITAAGEAFHALYDVVLKLGGSFYLTYGRHADRPQTLAAYPRFGDFSRQQREQDPGGLWQGDWLRAQLVLIGE